jgi:hypothetical protein
MHLPRSSRRAAIVPTRSILFLPGLETLAHHDAPRLPALERLLARAQARPGSCCWALLAEQAGGDLERWPVAPVSALADLGGASSACLRVEPLGMDAEQRGAFRMLAPALGLAREEAQALAAAFNVAFAGDGVRLQVATPSRWYLWQEGDGVPWRGFDAPPLLLDPAQRPAPPEPALRKLLSEAEMLFFAHPVNAARREQGLPLVAGLHPWGGGRLDLPAAAADSTAAPVAGEPYLHGLSRLGLLSQRDGARDEAPAWPLAPEAFQADALESIDREVIEPLLARLRRRPGMQLHLATGLATHAIGATDLLKFWRRPRHWALAC